MTRENAKRLAQLLAERVKDRDAAGDHVGMFTTARLLDQVESEIGRPPEPEDGGQKEPRRRVFVRG